MLEVVKLKACQVGLLGEVAEMFPLCFRPSEKKNPKGHEKHWMANQPCAPIPSQLCTSDLNVCRRNITVNEHSGSDVGRFKLGLNK